MNKRIFIITVLFSCFVQAEYYMELVLYDEVSHLSWLQSLLSYLLYVCYTIVHFNIIFTIDIFIIRKVEQWLPWQDFFVRRIVVEFFLTSINAVIITVPLTIYINYGWIMPLFDIPSEELYVTLYYNLLYITMYNVLFVVTYEAVFLYAGRKNMQLEWEKTQRQKILSQFEALKNQVNPHFLFNSMNALAGIIQSDPKQAVKFTKEFSRIFRYALELKDNIVIPLHEELAFTNAYIYLQKLRYGENLRISIDIDAERMDEYIPPFSLQLLVENAIKHNVISSEGPLLVNICNQGHFLKVTNNVQPREEEVKSLKVGLTNLKSRYALISDLQPSFKTNGTSYTARLPIISEDQLN